MQVLGDQLVQEYNTLADGNLITVFLKQQDDRAQYYFANHTTRTICWLNDDQPETMYDVANNRVANTLAQEYWQHMENFPTPRFINQADLKLLQNVLAGLAVGKYLTHTLRPTIDSDLILQTRVLQTGPPPPSQRRKSGNSCRFSMHSPAIRTNFRHILWVCDVHRHYFILC